MMRLRAITIPFLAWTMTWSAVAFAQSSSERFEAGAQIVRTTLRQFEGSDVGFGGRVGWRPGGMLGLEAELNFFPSDFPDRFPFTRARTEGLFGVTMGPSFGRVRVFGRVRPGFVVFSEAPQPFPCIAIFPPPLSCVLGAGRTLFALDVGGGVEIAATPTTFVRVDVGDRATRYPGPTFDANRQVRSNRFFSHDFRFAAGAGLRF